MGEFRSGHLHGLTDWQQRFVRWPLLPLSFYLMIAAYQLAARLSQATDTRMAGLAEYGLPLDPHIPFVPGSLLLYLSFFGFYLLHKPMLRMGDQGQKQFWRVERLLIAMTMLSCVCFLLFPTRIELREFASLSLATGAFPSWLADACGGLFLLDPAVNAWPSIHVSQPVFILLVVSSCRLYPPRVLVAQWVWLILVVLSVMTLKQHYVWDVLTGLLLALVCHQVLLFQRPLSEMPLLRAKVAS